MDRFVHVFFPTCFGLARNITSSISAKTIPSIWSSHPTLTPFFLSPSCPHNNHELSPSLRPGGVPFLASPIYTRSESLDDGLPLVGTGGHGHTYPGATVPFGMVQLSPDTRIEGWDGCSGYHYSDSVILGFSHTHLSGTGAPCLGDVMLTPTVGDIHLMQVHLAMVMLLSFPTTRKRPRPATTASFSRRPELPPK
jgi:hypothetical protein